MAMSMKERREKLKQRSKEAAKNRDSKGGGKKSILDLSELGDIKWYEPKAGGKNKNVMDIVPFVITQKWYKNLRSYSGKEVDLDIGELDYKLEIPVHRSIGNSNSTVLCLREAFGGKCPICDDMFEEWAKKGTSDFDEKKARALQPKWRDIYIIYDYKDPDYKGFKLWDVSYHLFEIYLMEAAETSEDGFICFSDPIDGRVIEWVGNEKTIGDKGHPFIDAGSCQAFKFLKREEPYSDEDIEENFSLDSLLKIPTFDEVARIHYDLEDDESAQDEEEKQAEEQDEPRTRTRSRREPEKEKQEDKKDKGTSRTRSRRSQPDEEEPIEDDFEGEMERDECPAGGLMGRDCQKFDECQNECPDDKFERCSQMHAEEGKSKKRRKVIEEEKPKEEESRPTRPSSRRRR